MIILSQIVRKSFVEIFSTICQNFNYFLLEIIELKRVNFQIFVIVVPAQCC